MLPKFVLAAVVLTSATALTTHAAKAATLQVPFSFTVAGKSMPAGLYSVEQDTFHNTVILRSKNASATFAAALVPGDPAPSDVHVALKFDSAGETHTLKTIQYGSRTTNRLDRDYHDVAGYDPARLSQGR
jgi:hypothetical protein